MSLRSNTNITHLHARVTWHSEIVEEVTTCDYLLHVISLTMYMKYYGVLKCVVLLRSEMVWEVTIYVIPRTIYMKCYGLIQRMTHLHLRVT